VRVVTKFNLSLSIKEKYNFKYQAGEVRVFQGSSDTVLPAEEVGRHEAKRHEVVVKDPSPRSSSFCCVCLSWFIIIQLLACVWIYKNLEMKDPNCLISNTDWTDTNISVQKLGDGIWRLECGISGKKKSS